MLNRIDIITLFPDWFGHFNELGLTGRAVADGQVKLHCWNPRDYTSDPHKSVDDRPYGGGPGMVMRPEPIALAIEAAKVAGAAPVVSYLSPQGRVLNQSGVGQLVERERLLLLCGRYEGIDERAIEQLVDEEWSIGDYVLSGGEPAALVLMDAVIRQLPGVLGHPESAAQDSFATGLLDHPHYTRPEHWRGQDVPPVLLSGDHGAVERWRQEKALERTQQRRPDLIEGSKPGD
ncbi:MAG TPA: tRNA (guanosine(37)-N1)-methyltransferase TrmD [Wenzhouxiangella sp.]